MLSVRFHSSFMSDTKMEFVTKEVRDDGTEIITSAPFTIDPAEGNIALDVVVVLPPEVHKLATDLNTELNAMGGTRYAQFRMFSGLDA